MFLQESEKLVIDKFRTPKELSTYMKTNIHYKNFDRLMSAEEVFNLKKGSCHDQVQFEHYVFNKMKINHSRLFMVEHNNDGKAGGRTHTLLYYYDNGKIYWFENSWENHKGIFGPYATLSELKKEVKEEMLYNSDYKYLLFSPVKNIKVGMNLKEYVEACLK